MKNFQYRPSSKYEKILTCARSEHFFHLSVLPKFVTSIFSRRYFQPSKASLLRVSFTCRLALQVSTSNARVASNIHPSNFDKHTQVRLRKRKKKLSLNQTWMRKKEKKFPSRVR